MPRKVNKYKGFTVNKIVALLLSVLFIVAFYVPYMKVEVPIADALGIGSWLDGSETVSIKMYLDLQDEAGLTGFCLGFTIIVVLVYLILQLCSHPRVSIIGVIGMLLVSAFWSMIVVMEKDNGERYYEVTAQFAVYLNWIVTILAMVSVFFKAIPIGARPEEDMNNGYVQNGYNMNNGYAQNGYVQNGYVQNGYAQNGYAQNGYAQNGYAQNNGYVQNGYAQNTGYASNETDSSDSAASNTYNSDAFNGQQ